MVNRDPNSALIAQLRQQLYELQKDLIGFKQLIVQNNITMPEDLSEVTKNLKEPGHLVNNSSKQKISRASGYYGDKETEDENKRLKEQLFSKDRTISKLETQISTLHEQFQDVELEKAEVAREKDMLSIKLETLVKICK